MSLIYVTGAPGSGKSTIVRSLQKLDLEAYDIDSPRFGGPFNLLSGKRVVIPPVDERSEDWFSHHEWRIDEEGIAGLKKKADKQMETIYLCGVAEGDKKILHQFDKIIYLRLEDNQLTKRLVNRIDNDFGKKESEREIIFERKRQLDERYSEFNSIDVDVSQTVNQVVRDVIVKSQNLR